MFGIIGLAVPNTFQLTIGEGGSYVTLSTCSFNTNFDTTIISRNDFLVMEYADDDVVCGVDQSFATTTTQFLSEVKTIYDKSIVN
jgi:hypothetical protein